MFNLNQNHPNLISNQSGYEIETHRSIIHPHCIVIGCKNGETRTLTNSVKFYQVPSLNNSCAIARQWYINTLREDLLENILHTKQSTQHFVCIEHFDEESFLIAQDPGQDDSNVIMILKEDAVPSLFEIEVFQKMISHQEQFTLNQQKITVQSKPSIPQNLPTQHKPKHSLLQNIILNVDTQQAQTLQQQVNSGFMNKRTRIDPDTRAALIQRVPKAVKRTAVLAVQNKHVQQDTQNAPKLQKAVKHTFPRVQQVQIPQFTSHNSNSNSEQKNPKIQKAVKHTSSVVNSILKDILPPPIMQSTKRATNSSVTPQNRAVKHTNPIVTNTQQKQPLTQVNQNSQSTAISGNKITITTTYVYKRVLQPPEIDLNLECEEEEIVYIKAPPKEVPKVVEEKKPEVKLDKKEEEKPKDATEQKDLKSQPKKESVKVPEPVKPTISKDEKSKEIKEAEKIESKPEIKQKLSTTKTQTKVENKTEIVNKTNDTNELAKYYSRRLGALKTSMEDTKNLANKKQKTSYLPLDLRPGNYPAKCNICDLILENNIELTSHICSHLESTDLSTEQSTYISPFDAVTTTCGVCETQFSHPFQLIKHLDSAHMKQLAEYKCRICEKQHEKLSELVEHLKQNHSEQEMPYRCDACGFRTSFYADAIYHIKKEHTNTLRHFCPYCLKSLVLPFNKKLGYVQCNIFYSHLITHFNKHENDQMIPSKCKHCTKCILHIRHMKEHLVFDHNSILVDSDEKNTDDEKKEDYEDKIDLDLVNAEKDMKRRVGGKGSKNEPDSKLTPQMSLRKRKRSFNDVKNESENENSESDSINVTDLDSQVKLDESLKDKLKNESKIQRSKRRTSEYSNLIKKAQSIKSAKNEFTDIKQETKQEQVEISVPTEPEVVYKKKQKALKQTNIRPNMQRKRFRSSNYGLEKDRSPSCSPKSASNQKISTLIFGNIKFSCVKNQFKCVECGECDLKSHYRTDYECHQCKYNTSCSKSFEFHLHGHLVSKRVALWNKSNKTELEEYQCPCGFSVNSELDNKSNWNTGNKVAEHLMSCEYKFCYFKSSKDDDDDEDLNENETIQNLGNFVSNRDMARTSRELFNKSDEIILNDSIEDIIEV